MGKRPGKEGVEDFASSRPETQGRQRYGVGKGGVRGQAWLHVLGAEMPLPPNSIDLPYLTQLGRGP